MIAALIQPHQPHTERRKYFMCYFFPENFNFFRSRTTLIDMIFFSLSHCQNFNIKIFHSHCHVLLETYCPHPSQVCGRCIHLCCAPDVHWRWHCDHCQQNNKNIADRQHQNNRPCYIFIRHSAPRWNTNHVTSAKMWFYLSWQILNILTLSWNIYLNKYRFYLIEWSPSIGVSRYLSPLWRSCNLETKL